MIDEKLSTHFSTSLEKLFKKGAVCNFGDFGPGAPTMADGKAAPYLEMADAKGLKSLIEERLDDYNMEPGAQTMDLVMFSDAIGHVCRVKRRPGDAARPRAPRRRRRLGPPVAHAARGVHRRVQSVHGRDRPRLQIGRSSVRT